MDKITIIGSGLAGPLLSILLAQKEWDEVCEAGLSLGERAALRWVRMQHPPHTGAERLTVAAGQLVVVGLSIVLRVSGTEGVGAAAREHKVRNHPTAEDV